MSDTLGSLMERNLFEVFGQRDSARRAAAIAELYTANCTFFEAEEQVNGREALNAKVGSILEDAPGFVFRPQGLRRSITILAVCGGSSVLPEPRRLSRVRTLRSSNTKESEPCTPFLMNRRLPKFAGAVPGAICASSPPPPDDRYESWSFSNSGRGVKLSVTSLPGSGFSPR